MTPVDLALLLTAIWCRWVLVKHCALRAQAAVEARINILMVKEWSMVGHYVLRNG